MEYATIIEVWYEADDDAGATRLADELTDMVVVHDAVRSVTTGPAEAQD